MPSMKLYKLFIWTGFLVTLIVFLYYNYHFVNQGNETLLSFKFSDEVKGKIILGGWSKSGLLNLAYKLVFLDFLFIIFFAAIIIFISNRQLRNESSCFLNSLLRGNYFFAFVAAIIDIIADVMVLRNMNHISTPEYFNTAWITGVSFALSAWCLFLWLISFIKTLIE